MIESIEKTLRRKPMNFHPIRSSILTRCKRGVLFFPPPIVVACGRGLACNGWRKTRIGLF